GHGSLVRLQIGKIESRQRGEGAAKPLLERPGGRPFDLHVYLRGVADGNLQINERHAVREETAGAVVRDARQRLQDLLRGFVDFRFALAHRSLTRSTDSASPPR